MSRTLSLKIFSLLLFLLRIFFYTSVTWRFSTGIRDSKFPQVSRTRLSILADLNNAVIWMVSNCPLISKSSSPSTNLLVTVPSALITIGISVTFMFYSIFSSLARSRYLYHFSPSFSFTLESAGTVKSNIPQFFPPALTRWFFKVTSLTELFENIKISDVLSFWREAGFYEKIWRIKTD